MARRFRTRGLVTGFTLGALGPLLVRAVRRARRPSEEPRGRHIAPHDQLPVPADRSADPTLPGKPDPLQKLRRGDSGPQV